MESPRDTPAPVNPEPLDPNSKKIAASLIRKHKLDTKKAYMEFSKESEVRLQSGKIPNKMYGEVVGVFSKLLPIQENLDKIQTASDVTKSEVFNNLVYDNVVQMNELLEDEVFEIPDVMNMSPAQEVLEYEQALIQVYNHIPNVKDNKKRQDLLWVGNLLNQMIGDIKTGGR